MAIRIGIRELRQHASKYLRRVRAGEVITITDRGEPFAEIRPVTRFGGVTEQLIAEGRARPARRSLSEYLNEHPPVRLERGQARLSDAVIEARQEERP